MRIVIRCKCGQHFATDSRFIGRTVNCFSCGESMTIQATSSPPPVPMPPPVQMAATGVRVRCACGWAFNAPAMQQGRSVRCPGCGGMTEVPVNDPLGLGYSEGELRELDSLVPLTLPRPPDDRWKIYAFVACGIAALIPIALLVFTAIYNF